MIKKSIVFCMSLICLNSYGQNEIDQSKISEELLNHSRDISSIDLRDKNLVGSVYVNVEFLPAKLSKNNTIYSANYNAFRDEIVINKDGKLFTLVKNFDNEIIFVGANKMYDVFKHDDNDGKEVKAFFVVLSKGNKLSLLKKERIKFYDAVKPSTGYDKYKPPTLKRESDKLFLGFKDNSAQEIPSKRKDIYKLFTNKDKEIETYAKKQKLNPKKESDLIKLVKYFNTL